MQQEIIQFQSLTQCSYLLQKSDQPHSRLYILNHGFMANNEIIWRRLIDQIPEHSHVLAANAPFPIPTRHDQSWKVGYSWFFYDNFNDKFLIGYDICKDFIGNLCQHLGYSENKKTIVGYSQGGYAAAHMAESLKNVDHIVGIGCRFRIKSPRWPKGLMVDAVHGEADDVVEWSGAQESFSLLPEQHKGNLTSLPGVGHKPTPEMLTQVGEWLKERR